MGKGNIPFVSFNRGLISPKALARVDLDRTKLSAAVMTNWLPKTQGAMRLRPGTKHLGSSFNDSGAAWIEFVAATDDTALLELTDSKMRVWDGDALLGRPAVTATVSLSDTGWSEDSDGGGVKVGGSGATLIPLMSAETTDGVQLTASSTHIIFTSPAWRAADRNPATTHTSTTSAIPGWYLVDFGSGNTKKVEKLTLQANDGTLFANAAPKDFKLQGNNVDTGTGWTSEINVSGEAAWSVGETRTYTDTGYTDTGANAWRYWRVYITATGQGSAFSLAEMQFTSAASVQTDTGQVVFSGGSLTLNSGAIGSLSRTRKGIVIAAADTGVEHSLDISVSRGPVQLRLGSTAGDDDYISEASLATGAHNLAFTPVTSKAYVTLQTRDQVDRVVSKFNIGDSGTVELPTPWGATALDNIRYDQSADIVFVNAKNIKQQQIERRGTGRSWSVVDYVSNKGPFSSRFSDAKLFAGRTYGNTTLKSDIPVFKPAHVGCVWRITHGGQGGIERIGLKDATTSGIEINGVSDTGETDTGNERFVKFDISGTYAGTVEIQRSFDSATSGFHAASPKFLQLDVGTENQVARDTGTFVRVVNDRDDNVTAWYRAQLINHTSGTAVVTVTCPTGLTEGIGRITNYNSNQSVDFEIISRIADTGQTDNWQDGSWSNVRGFPGATALHEGRLAHAGGANIWLSVADDYNNHDDTVEGDAGPISRTFGSGPVDSIFYLLSLQRLLAGTAGGETAVKSSSLDEVLTPTNSSAKTVSTQGSANLRAIKRDTEGFFVQRSKQRLFSLAIGTDVFDYTANDITLLVPDLLAAGVVDIAIQRQPDTRIHCVLANGKVAIMTYQPAEQVLCWSLYETNGSVERAMVLPAVGEDAVYYHVNRTINSVTRRFLERWATEAESEGDTGLSYLSDCSKSFTTDTGRASTATGMSHLEGATVVAWANDTGQTDAGKDLSPDVEGTQTTFTVTGGNVGLGEDIHHAVVGLAYTANWTSTKLHYAAEQGTALAQMKRTDKIAFILHNTHNNGLFFGNDTGLLDPMPRISDEGGEVDPNKIFKTFDEAAMAFPGLWDADSRIHLQAKSPRPVTILAAIPTVATKEKV